MGDICSTWDTPFTNSRYPSVGLVMEPDGHDSALLVVAPGGLDTYPKYVVRFKNVFAATSGEEAGFILDVGQQHCPPEATACIWHASPHAAAYANTVFGYCLQIRHYVVYGADNIASVIAGETPTIEVIHEPSELWISHSI